MNLDWVDAEIYALLTEIGKMLGHPRKTAWHPRADPPAKGGTAPAASLETAYFRQAATANLSEPETASTLLQDCDREPRKEECHVDDIPQFWTLLPWTPPTWPLQILITP